MRESESEWEDTTQNGIEENERGREFNMNVIRLPRCQPATVACIM